MLSPELARITAELPNYAVPGITTASMVMYGVPEIMGNRFSVISFQGHPQSFWPDKSIVEISQAAMKQRQAIQ
jgi:hypothetical protein